MPDKSSLRADTPHVHKWQPVGTVKEQHRFYDGITNPLAMLTLAITSCECGALRRTEVARRYLRG